MTALVHVGMLRSARLKLRQLEREIHDGRTTADLLHTLSKLGMFLADAVGDQVWSEAGKNLDGQRSHHRRSRAARRIPCGSNRS